MREPIQMLWVGPRLSAMEQLSIRSYQRQGHPVHLYLYEKCDGIPEGTIVKQGNEILPRSAIEKFKCFANFSDLFRWTVLYEKGYWWADLDTVAVRPLPDHLPYVFSDGDCGKGKSRVGAGNIKLPDGSDLARWAISEINKMDTLHPNDFSQFGPTLLMRGINEFGLHRYILPVWAFLPIDAWSCHRIATEDVPISPDSYVVHLYNNIWGFRKLDKDARYPSQSLYEKLKRFAFSGRTHLSYTKPRKNVLIAMVTCDAKRGWAQAQYDTWTPAARANGFDVTFFDGENLGVADSPYIPAITEKAAAIYKWGFEHGYSHILKCDDDCYLDADKLTVPRAHYTGIPCGPNDGGKAEFGFPDYPTGTHPYIFASGGAAWFSRHALRVLIDNLPISGDWTDDRWAGQILGRAGYQFKPRKGYYWYPDVPESGDKIVAMTQIPTINAMYDMHMRKKVRPWLSGNGLPSPLSDHVTKLFNTTTLVPDILGLQNLGAKLRSMGAM